MRMLRKVSMRNVPLMGMPVIVILDLRLMNLCEGRLLVNLLASWSRLETNLTARSLQTTCSGLKS